jgi:hypothetical protein
MQGVFMFTAKFRLTMLGVVCAMALVACGGSPTPAAVAPAPQATVQQLKPTETPSAPSPEAKAPTATTQITSAAAPTEQRFPDVVKVELESRGDRRFDVVVTISSPYDTPQRYADGWRVLDPAGKELGVHTLLHDHAGEQPFTRVQSAVEIPEGITSVTVEGRDKTFGFGGQTMTVAVPEQPKPTEAPVAEKVLATGQFERVMYDGSGEALIVQLPDNTLELRFKDFKVDAGPALYVYLSPVAEIPKTSGQGDVPGSIALAPLKALTGEQTYVLPAGTDIGNVKAILIWCKEFSVGFVSAPLVVKHLA